MDNDNLMFGRLKKAEAVQAEEKGKRKIKHQNQYYNISYFSLIKKAKKKIYPEKKQFNKKFKFVLNSIANNILEILYANIKNLMKLNKMKTITYLTVELASQSLFPQSIFMNENDSYDEYGFKDERISELKNELRKFENETAVNAKPFGRQTGKIRNLLKPWRVGRKSLLGINRVIYFFIENLINLTKTEEEKQNKQNKQNKKTTHKDLFHSIKGDHMFYYFFLKHQIVIPGVYNYNETNGIHKFLRTVPKKVVNNEQRAEGQKGGNNVSRTLRKVRKVQKDTGFNRIPVALFVNIIRGKLYEYSTAINAEAGKEYEYRCARSALSAIQLFCESRIVKLFAGANLICIENNRKTVTIRDLMLANKLFMEDVRLMGDNLEFNLQKRDPEGLIVDKNTSKGARETRAESAELEEVQEVKAPEAPGAAPATKGRKKAPEAPGAAPAGRKAPAGGKAKAKAPAGGKAKAKAPAKAKRTPAKAKRT
jgi:histone H3/H4